MKETLLTANEQTTAKQNWVTPELEVLSVKDNTLSNIENGGDGDGFS